MLIDYLCGSMGVQTLKAYGMPENVYSEKVLLKNGFAKEKPPVWEQNLGRQRNCRTE